MADAGLRRIWAALVVGLAACTALVVSVGYAAAQTAENPPTPEDMVVDVRIVGNQAVSLQRIVTYIRTRAGRNYDPDQIEKDVRELSKSRLFVNVTTSYQRVPEGVIVLFQVVERPTLAYVKYVGTTMLRSTMEKQTSLKVGDAIDPYMVEDARRKLEDYYHEKGFPKARVVVSEGNKPGDRGAVFLIHEGPKQKIYDVEFEGNTIADDARLKTQVSSKPPILYMFKGEVDENKIDEDVAKLTAYYRSLGFFNAKIGRELEFGESGKWATLRFVIDEGPRYKVNNVSIVGVSKFSKAELEAAMQLKGGKFFEQDTMQRDITMLQDRYGEAGHVYCVINPEQRLSEVPGEMDLVYQIEEGAKYHINRVTVQIEGDNPHTRVNTVLNRVDVRPMDIADITKFRESERRLKASSLFNVNPAQGSLPTITWEAADENIPMTAGRSEGDAPPSNYRGQSPDLVAAPSYSALPSYEIPADQRRTAAYPMFVAAQEQPAVAVESTGFGNPFLANKPPVGDVNASSTPLPATTSYVVETAPHDSAAMGPVAPTAPQHGPQVRFQSPGFGQVPLYSTTPGGNAAPAASYGPTNGGVVQTQYVAPAPQYGTPAPQYAAPPAGNYGPQAGAPPVANGPNFGQVVPQPYMGNAPGDGAPPIGYDNGGNLFGNQVAPPSSFPPAEPTLPLDVRVGVQEAQTGRFMVGVGVNSNAGVVGSIVLDEQNADITRLPTSWRDFIEGRAFRGAGQQLRIEAVPGTQVSRYSLIFRQPYLFDTRIQFGLSGYYFQRYYQDWLEERLGGRVSLGYQFPYVPDLSVNTAMRMEKVNISQPTVPTPPQLARVLGDSGLFVWENAIVHDTRDNTFLATQGHRLMLGFDQAFGDYSFSRGTIDARQHFLLRERPDRSGRHTLTLSSQLGFTGSATPIFENYFAGGFSSMRGFNFRGVGPYVGPVNVGGQFQWLNTVEYMFPLAADDMIRGVVFCDFGTVEEKIAMHADNFRVAPGFGLRLTIPAMGPAPIALDFSAPVAHAPGDNIQNFAFYIGMNR
jgi:outer membrane protein insertion porin family